MWVFYKNDGVKKKKLVFFFFKSFKRTDVIAVTSQSWMVFITSRHEAG